jgi:RNA polymerase sigma factor (sigma-70 family)
LEEEGDIAGSTPSQFCFNTARYIFLESLRKRQHHQSLHEGLATSSDFQKDAEEEQHRSDCLERCLQKLDPQDQTLILSYYQGERSSRIENRKTMAAKLGVSINALSIRACRIRIKLESCIRKCLKDGK